MRYCFTVICLSVMMIGLSSVNAQEEKQPYFSADSSIQQRLRTKNIAYFQSAHTIRGTSADTTYYLSYRRIIPESEVFSIGYQTLVRGKDYTIRYSDGEVRFAPC